MPDLKTQLGDYLDHVVERVDMADILEGRSGIEPLQQIRPRGWSDRTLRWVYAAAAAIAVLLLVGGVAWLARSSQPEPADPAPTTSVAPGTTTTTTAREPTSTTSGALPPTEIDLEINVTVFLDPVKVTSSAQAETTIRAILGDAEVESVTVIDRAAAWSEARSLAARRATPLDPTLRNSLGEVARIVVLDPEVRNRLTDAFEDSTDVSGVAYIVGTTQGSSEPMLVRHPITWEILGYFWQPAD